MAEISLADVMALLKNDQKSAQVMTELSSGVADVVTLLEEGPAKQAKANAEALMPLLKAMMAAIPAPVVNVPAQAAPTVTVQGPGAWTTMDADISYTVNGRIDKITFKRS